MEEELKMKYNLLRAGVLGFCTATQTERRQNQDCRRGASAAFSHCNADGTQTEKSEMQ
jgi:hypothetical protein